MVIVNLVRDEPASPDGTFGHLTAVDQSGQLFSCVTMEDDWLDNAKGKSCIPAGTYTLRRTIFHKHNIECFEVTGVPGRSRILIHPANTEEDVEGCIGPGTRFGEFLVTDEDATVPTKKLKKGAANSGVAFRQFMEFMGHVDTATLTISWGAGRP